MRGLFLFMVCLVSVSAIIFPAENQRVEEVKRGDKLEVKKIGEKEFCPTCEKKMCSHANRMSWGKDCKSRVLLTECACPECKCTDCWFGKQAVFQEDLEKVKKQCKCGEK